MNLFENTDDHTGDTCRILLDGDWDLRDLYEFPHALLQCYSFIYCLDSEIPAINRAKINEALLSYPWQGGFSYVNIYGLFEREIPNNERPRLKSIHKASPGWIDLFANQEAITNLSITLGQMVIFAAAIEKIYNKASNLIKKIKKNRTDANNESLRATANEIKEINRISQELAKSLGFKSLAALNESTGDPEVSLKLLMAHYRRLEPLLKQQLAGKVTFLSTEESKKLTSPDEN